MMAAQRWRSRHGSRTTAQSNRFNYDTRDRQKAPEIAPLFNAFQRAGPRPENSFADCIMTQRGEPDRIPADFRMGGQAMESVIAKLLQDFEQGKMNRRQLIQSLSLAAA